MKFFIVAFCLFCVCLINKVMVVLDAREHIHVVDTQDLVELEDLDLAVVQLAYSTSHFKSLAAGKCHGCSRSPLFLQENKFCLCIGTFSSLACFSRFRMCCRSVPCVLAVLQGIVRMDLCFTSKALFPLQCSMHCLWTAHSVLRWNGQQSTRTGQPAFVLPVSGDVQWPASPAWN